MILTEETEILGERNYTAWVVDGWMSMEQWWNDTDRGNKSAVRETYHSVVPYTKIATMESLYQTRCSTVLLAASSLMPNTRQSFI